MISNNINKYRKAKKITLEELSKKIKMSYTGLRLALENDDFKIDLLHSDDDSGNIVSTVQHHVVKSRRISSRSHVPA